MKQQKQKTLVDRVVEEILGCSRKRRQMEEPLDCPEALEIFRVTYDLRVICGKGFPEIKAQRKQLALDIMRDYLWFNERPMGDYGI